MIFSRNKLAFLALAATASLAASPAHASEEAVAMSGAIDLSKVAKSGQDGPDAEFQELFADWEALDTGTAAAIQVSVPSRMPLADTRLTSSYGMRDHPVLRRRAQHNGVDLAAPSGTPIYATADGMVSKAERWSSYGNYVSIEHGAQLQTRFAHMSRIAVSAGQRVRKGDVIGYVGSTGRSTGPHLHYEVRIAGEAVNPIPYMVESEAQQAFALATGRGGQGGPE